MFGPTSLPTDEPMSRLALLPLLLLAAATSAHAQMPPSFAGAWARVDSAPERPTVAATGDARFPIGNMGGGWGSPFTIRQTADSLVVEVVHFSSYDLQPKLRYDFALDGSETRQRINIAHAELVLRSRVRWDGATLVITTLYPNPPEIGGAPTEVRQRLTLDESGRLLMETARPGARAPDVVRTLYVRR